MGASQINRKIVVTANSLWNILNFRLGLIRHLQANGYEVIVVAPPDHNPDKLIKINCTYIPISIDRSGTSLSRDSLLLTNYWLILRVHRPLVVLSFTVKPNIYSSLAARVVGVPVINNVSGLGTTFIRENWISHIVKWLYRTALSRSHRVFFQNRDDAELFVTLGLTSKERNHVLPGSGVDLNHFTSDVTPELSADSKFRFLLVGRLLWDKGIGEFLDAARVISKKTSRAIFQVLGPLDPENRTAISREMLDGWTREGLIEYLGSADDVRPHIETAHCIVLPSYREGLPRSLLEGAAMSRPLIATDVPGCREVVDDGVNGFLCTARDVPSLVSAMCKMLELDGEQWIQMSAASRRKVVQGFSEAAVLDQYLCEVNRLIRE